MRRTRICFVLPSLNGGGAERAAVQVLNALDPAVWDRSMYLFDRDGPYLDALDPAIRLGSGREPRAGANGPDHGGRSRARSVDRIRRWLALRRYLRRTQP